MKKIIASWRAKSDELPSECLSISDCKEADVIVSLTSYPPRFSTLHKVIVNLLRQSLKPARICLWIGDQDMPLLPEKVRALTKSGLEIYSICDFKSYDKIIHCHAMFPDAVIVTADDDVAYPADWLRLLWAYHLLNPEKVICHRARYMTFQPSGDINPYWLWPNIDREIESHMVFPIGTGGVLYPRGSFHKDIGNSKIFTDLCRHGDDIWLKAMTLLNSRQCIKIHHYPKYFKHVKGSQKVSLKTDNIRFQNDEQIQNVFNRYAILRKMQLLAKYQVSLQLQA